MKRALVVASVGNFFGLFERNDIQILRGKGYAVDCACNASPKLGSLGDTSGITDLAERVIQVDFSRSPYTKQTMTAYKQLKRLLQTEHYDLIHCHAPAASVLTRVAARKCHLNGTKVVYTAHGFHFFKGAPLLNWLLYYPVERLCARYTDALITINREDYELARKKMKAGKVYYIPGVGIDTHKFADVVVNREEKRKEIGVPMDAVVLLSVGELNCNKNHTVVIRALGRLADKRLHYVIAGQGALKAELAALASRCGVANNVHFLGFRKDIPELCKAADIFCFPSKREGLGLAALEAMAAGLPVVTSNVQGIKDYSVDEETGYICTKNYVEEYAKAIRKLAGDRGLRNSIGEVNIQKAKAFDLKKTDEIMRQIYANILCDTICNDKAVIIR